MLRFDSLLLLHHVLSLSLLSLCCFTLSLSVPDEPERLVNLRLVVYIYIIICFFL